MTANPDIRAGRDVEVRGSPIHGLGVYALRAFEAGEVVLRWDVSRRLTVEELASLPEGERRYTHPFDGKTTILVQPPERYVNHSCDNNSVVRDFCDVAVRHIAPGEEVTSDYSADGSGSKFACSCGAVNCRGVVG
ncbi:MAG: SET domain-containing protein-lysine N-methyltransferase [Acidobacteriota bacterium]|nr:SET domain-containing protein-lysine N-methyltransferase [Acidobacteriota bacterium]